MTARKLEYTEYLKSQYWSEVRQLVKARDGHRCVLCNSSKALEVHHRTYVHLKCEKDHLGDVHTLCSTCHSAHHGQKIAAKSPRKAKRFTPKPALVIPPKYGQGVAKANAPSFVEKIITPKPPSTIRYEKGWVFCTGDLLPKIKNERAVIQWITFKLGKLKKNWKSRLVNKTIPVDILLRDAMGDLMHKGVHFFRDEACTIKFDPFKPLA